MGLSGPYDVDYDEEAQADAQALSTENRLRVKKKIEWLAAHFDVLTPESLKDPRFRGMLKLRIGDYRVLYSANRRRRTLTVHLIKHRREVYD